MQVKNKTSYKTRLMAVTSYSLFTALCHRKPTGLAFSTVPPEAYRASLPLLPRLTLINKKKRSARWPSRFWEGSHSRSICGHQAAHIHIGQRVLLGGGPNTSQLSIGFWKMHPISQLKWNYNISECKQQTTAWTLFLSQLLGCEMTLPQTAAGNRAA